MKANRTLIYTLIFICFISCQNDKIELPAPAGNIVGIVTLFDEEGKEIKGDRSGVTVKIEKSDYFAISDRQGKFEIKNIPQGSYNVVYEKEGFGTKKVFGFQFVGGNLPVFIDEMSLFEQSKLEVEEFSIKQNFNNLYLSGVFKSEGELYSMILLIGDNPDVSLYNYKVKYESKYCCGPAKAFGFYTDDLTLFGFTVGQKIYGTVYFSNHHNNLKANYYDPTLEKEIFSAYKRAIDIFEVELEETDSRFD